MTSYCKEKDNCTYPKIGKMSDLNDLDAAVSDYHATRYAIMKHTAVTSSRLPILVLQRGQDTSAAQVISRPPPPAAMQQLVVTSSRPSAVTASRIPGVSASGTNAVTSKTSAVFSSRPPLKLLKTGNEAHKTDKTAQDMSKVPCAGIQARKKTSTARTPNVTQLTSKTKSGPSPKVLLRLAQQIGQAIYGQEYEMDPLVMPNPSSPNSQCQTFGSTIVDSQYFKKEDIGRGHFGVVWRAVSKHSKFANVYAIKEICIAGTKDNQLQDKIEGEIDIVKRLNHKNIVQFIEHFYDLNKKTFYVVMEFCINGDLSDAIKTKRDAGRTFPVNLVKKWYTELIQAVQYLHKIMKIWHRDLKPSNIFLNGENSLKLGDFGVSKVLEYSSELASTYCGTRLYMAPEVLTRGGQYNSRADMFSIGVILYEVITLRRPFPTEKHLWNYCNDNGDYEDINPIDHPDFARNAPYLLDLVPRLLSKNPSGRPKAEKCRIWKCLDDQEKENESPNKCTCKNVVKKQRTTPPLPNLSSRPSSRAVLNPT